MNRVLSKLASPGGNWSDARQWRFDLLKNVITFGFVTAITLVALDNLEENRVEQRFLAQAAFQERVRASDEFRRASLRYNETAREAYLGMARVAGGGRSAEPSIELHAIAWQNHLIALERLSALAEGSEDLSTCLSELRALSVDRNGIYLEARSEFIRSDLAAGDPWRTGASLSGAFQELYRTFGTTRESCVRELDDMVG